MSDQSNPASEALAVTPSDSDADWDPVPRGLYIGGAGDVTVKMMGSNGNVVTFTAVPAGTILPIRARRVNSTGTTATAIVRIW